MLTEVEKQIRWLKQAINLSVEAHQNQRDKSGKPYIGHIMRVTLLTQGDFCRYIAIIALLHDVVEDTDVTLSGLTEMGFPKYIVDAVGLLTRLPGQKDDDYYEQIKKSNFAIHVKLADLRDNMDLTRFTQPTEKDIRRSEYYRSRYRSLLAYAEKAYGGFYNRDIGED